MLNSNYVSGLVDGEGCFCITISRHKTKRFGVDPRLEFEIEMIIEDKLLLEKLQETLGCGRVFVLSYERYGWRPHAKFAVKSQKEIFEKIVPFFIENPLHSKKKKDFEFFLQAVEIFKAKRHLMPDGIRELREIQSKMNLRRRLKWSSARVRENRVPSGDRNLNLVTG